MKQKTKQLQSSGETRKTNQPWHFLSTLNSLLLSKLLLLLIIPVMGSVNAWGASGDVLFSQNFNSATEVAYTNGTATSITSTSGNNIVGTTATSQFSFIGITDKSSTGIAINSATGGNSVSASGIFRAYCNYTGQNWSLVHNTGFAATAPTALKVSMKIFFTQLSSGSDYSVSFAVGDGFSNATSGPATSYVHSGFSIKNNSSATLTQYMTNTDLIEGKKSVAITQSSWQNVTWVINNTGSALEYDDPASGKSTVNNDCFDLWIGTTKVLTNKAATTATKTLQNLYIGDPAGKRNTFQLDDLVVTDLTPGGGSVAVTSVSLDQTSKTIGVGDNFTLTPTISPANATNKSVSWSSNDSGVASVSNGTVNGVAAGSATITVTTVDGSKTATCNVTVKAKHSVTYNLGGGTGTLPTQADVMETGTFSVASGSGLSKDGYTFAGWSDGSGTYTAGDTYTMGTEDVTLTAQWIENVETYTVTFNGNGHGTPGETSLEGASVTLPTCTANTYYQFVGWSKSPEAATATYAAGASYTPEANETLYAVYKWQLLSQVSPAGAGNVVMRYDGETGTEITSENNYIAKNQPVWVKATANTGYTFNTWSNGATASTNPISFDESGLSSVSAKTMIANFTANTYNIKLDKNNVSASTDGSAIATYNSNKLTGISAPTYSGKVVEGYYKESGCTNKIADASGNLVASTDYTTSGSLWKNDGTVTLYAKWVDAPAGDTTLPVTYNFRNTTKWPESGNIGTAGNLVELTNRAEGDGDNHSFYIRKSADNKFTLENGVKLSMNDNGSTSNFIAIPISGINSRIDIDVWVPYDEKQSYTLKYALVTGTTTPSASGTNLGNFKSANKYVEDHFNFRIENISASNGVLYLGRGQSNWPDMYQIRITTLESSISADPESVTIKDNASPAEVTVTNNTAYNVRINGTPDASVATAWYDPATNKLTVTPVAPGTTEVNLYVDENGNGVKDATETKTLSVPVTIQGIKITTQPAGAVYATNASASALTVVANLVGGSGTLKYQWYKNTVNSNTGGTAVSDPTTNPDYTPSTTATEDASFYYCVVSASGYTSKTSNVAYVLTSSTKRYFQMSNVAGNKSTSETEAIDITGQVIAGGEAKYVKGANGDGKYVLRPSGFGHYFHSSAYSYFKIELPNNIATDDIISVTVPLVSGSERGIEISTSSDFTTKQKFTTTSGEKVVAIKAQTAGLSGVKTLYVRGFDNTDGYFTNLIISKYIAVAASVSPSTQTVTTSQTPAPFVVTASGGVGDYTYQWKYSATEGGTYENVTDDGTGATTASYTPAAKNVAGTTYYKCVVTSGGSEYTTSAVSLIVESSIDYYVIKKNGATGGDANFNASGKYTISNMKSVYTGQKNAPTRNFWYINSETPGSTDGTSSAFSSNNLDMKNANNYVKTTSFYVKGASAFRIICAAQKDDRTYSLTIGGTSIGKEYPRNTENTAVLHSLDNSGSIITIDSPSDEIKIQSIIFYEKLPNTLSIEKDGAAVSTSTMYVDSSTEQFDIIAGGDGTISATSSDENVATVSYDENTGRITVTRATPAKTGSITITVRQAATANYEEASKTLTVTVKNHELTLNFALSQIDVNASLLTKDAAVPAGSKPTFRAYIDGVEQTGDAFAALGIKFLSDDITIVEFSEEDDYSTLTYKGGQGSAKIYAYESGTYNVNTSFDFIVEAGKNNDADEATSTVAEQQKFLLQGDDGSSLVTMTYGGYRYKPGNWKSKDSKPGAKIDDHEKYIRHNDDALDEYKRQLRGMLDETTDQTKALSGAPDADFWYEITEDKPKGGGKYSKYERIRPFTLPCRGGYLKFDVHKTGQMTVYVWQNGQLDTNKGIGSKPRLGYWFDEEGWVQHPIVAPITKDKISGGSDDSGTFSDKGTLTGLMSRWKSANDDEDIKKLLTNKYCKVESPTENTDKSQFHENNTDSGWESAYENPYYWMTSAEITANNALTMPKKMTPVPYHNGYMIHEDSYLKYVLNVVAGKTYYFFGMMTKIGYAGMNFIVDDVVADDGYTSVAETLNVHTVDALHLNNTDNMADIVDGLTNPYTVYNEVTLPSNYRAGKWNTICLPFALSESQVEAAFGYGTQLTLYNGLIKKGTDYTIKYLSHVDRNILPGQPYFIKPTGVDKGGNPLQMVDEIIGTAVEGQTGTRITFNNVVIDKNHFSLDKCKYNNESDVDGSGAAIAGDGGFTFVGAYANPYVEQYSYLIHPSTGNIRQYTGASNTNKLDSYRAYLKPVTSDIQHMSLDATFSEVRENTWDESGEATEVISLEEEVLDALNSGRMQMPKKAYNLMGQEIDPRSAKGLVIINGKKVMY